MIDARVSHARRDPRLRGAALPAYLFCLEYLDTATFRPLKVVIVATEIHAKKATAIDALHTLARHGFVEREEGHRAAGEPRRYRLLPYPFPHVKPRAA